MIENRHNKRTLSFLKTGKDSFIGGLPFSLYFHFSYLLHKYIFYVIISKRSQSWVNVVVACGEVAKWLNAADCKSALNEFDSSNLPLSTTLGCSQVVRQQTLTLSFRWFDPSHPSQS